MCSISSCADHARSDFLPITSLNMGRSLFSTQVGDDMFIQGQVVLGKLVCTGLSQGEKGEKGDLGPVGIQGPVGPKGEPGAKGERGKVKTINNKLNN